MSYARLTVEVRADPHTDEPRESLVVTFLISLPLCNHVRITAAQITTGFPSTFMATKVRNGAARVAVKCFDGVS